jgi:predicted Zn-dependent protease
LKKLPFQHGGAPSVQFSEMSNAIFAQGNAAFQRSDFKTAYKHFTNALDLDPKNVVLLDCRAATSQKLGNHKDALRDARLIVKCEPTQARGYIRLAKVLDAMNQKDKAQVILGVGSRRVPRTDKLYLDMSKRRKASHDIVTPSKSWYSVCAYVVTGIISSRIHLVYGAI